MCALVSFAFFRLFAFRASIWTCTELMRPVVVYGHKLLTISDTLSFLFVCVYWYQNMSFFLYFYYVHHSRFDAASDGVGQWGWRSWRRAGRCRFVRHGRWRRRRPGGWDGRRKNGSKYRPKRFDCPSISITCFRLPLSRMGFQWRRFLWSRLPTNTQHQVFLIVNGSWICLSLFYPRLSHQEGWWILESRYCGRGTWSKENKIGERGSRDFANIPRSRKIQKFENLKERKNNGCRPTTLPHSVFPRSIRRQALKVCPLFFFRMEQSIRTAPVRSRRWRDLPGIYVCGSCRLYTRA